MVEIGVKKLVKGTASRVGEGITAVGGGGVDILKAGIATPIVTITKNTLGLIIDTLRDTVNLPRRAVAELLEGNLRNAIITPIITTRRLIGNVLKRTDNVTGDLLQMADKMVAGASRMAGGPALVDTKKLEDITPKGPTEIRGFSTGMLAANDNEEKKEAA